MEGVKRGNGFGSLAMVVLVLMCAEMVMVPGVSATRWIVGANMGWTTNFNYTVWAQDKHFYNGDWLCKLLSITLSFRGCECACTCSSLDLLSIQTDFSGFFYQ